jgi:hypothetical protein
VKRIRAWAGAMSECRLRELKGGGEGEVGSGVIGRPPAQWPCSRAHAKAANSKVTKLTLLLRLCVVALGLSVIINGRADVQCSPVDGYKLPP